MCRVGFRYCCLSVSIKSLREKPRAPIVIPIKYLKPTSLGIFNNMLLCIWYVKIDELDRRLMYSLYQDGWASVPALSKKFGVNPSMLYSRIKRLHKNKVIKKFTIQVDDSKLGLDISAQVGINRNPKFKQRIHDQLVQSPNVVSVVEVTGRFDLMVTIRVKNLELLHNTVIDMIGRIEGVYNTETFVELERTDKELEYLKVD